MIRMGLQSAKAGKELVWDEHMPHCLDYIRKVGDHIVLHLFPDALLT